VKHVRDWISVRTLYSRGVPIRQIARDLKMSRNTVRSLIKCESEPQYKKRSYETKIDTYLDQIQAWYLEPQYDFNGTRIFRELKKQGYSGSISPIYRYGFMSISWTPKVELF
jgi:transposase